MMCVGHSRKLKLLSCVVIVIVIINATGALILTHSFRFVSVKFYLGEPLTCNIYRRPFKFKIVNKDKKDYWTVEYS